MSTAQLWLAAGVIIYVGVIIIVIALCKTAARADREAEAAAARYYRAHQDDQ